MTKIYKWYQIAQKNTNGIGHQDFDWVNYEL